MLAFRVLPHLHEQVTSDVLAAAVAEHLEQTKEHVARVEIAFRAVGAEPSSNLCEPAERLARHHDELVEKIVAERLRDLFHAASAARTEHFELATYDVLIALGRELAAGEGVDVLQRNRDEDEQALRRVEREVERLAAEACA